MNVDINLELIILLKLFVSLLLGALIGLDRERHSKDLGIRTYAAVTVGATLFTCVTAHMNNDISAVSRIVANIITGIGFLGVGVIYRDGAGTSRGLTTAATIWCSAAVGVAVGLNMYVIAVGGACILYGLISLHHQSWYVKWKKDLASKL